MLPSFENPAADSEATLSPLGFLYIGIYMLISVETFINEINEVENLVFQKQSSMYRIGDITYLSFVRL